MSREPLRLRAGELVSCNGILYTIQALLGLTTVRARREPDGVIENLRVADLEAPERAFPADAEKAVDIHGVTEADWKEARRRRGLIKPLLNKPRRSREEVETRATKAGYHWTTFYRWIRLYEESGQLSALLPYRPTGGKAKGRLPKDVERITAEVIEQVYLRSQKPRVKAVKKELDRRCRLAQLKPPSIDAVRWRIAQLSEEKKVQRRQGRRAAEQAFKPKAGIYREATRPLMVAQIDHSELDLIVVDEKYRQPIGRPWLTVMVDVFTRMVLGFYLSLDPPGNAAVGLCIVHAVLPKEGWLTARGLASLHWPSYGLLGTIHADNAKEFRGKMLSRACEEYQMILQWRPVKQPRYGAHIERLCGTLARELHELPGTTFSSPAERGEYDSSKRAVLTLKELEEWLTRFIVEVYHRRPHRGIGGIAPLQLYEDELLGTAERPGIGAPLVVSDPEKFRIDLLPFVDRTVQDYGVQLDYIHYYGPALDPYIAARSPATSGRRPRIRFHFDPRGMSPLYFFDRKAGHYLEVPFRDLRHPSISRWELRLATKRAKELSPDGKVNEAAIFAAYDENRQLVEAAAQKTATARRRLQRMRDHARDTGSGPRAESRMGLPTPETQLDVSEDSVDRMEMTEPLKPFDIIDLEGG